MIRLLILAWLALMGVAPVARDSAATDAGTRPNVVFILVDDLRWNVLGCTGDRVARTPNIDRLAQRGTLFRNAFVTTSICAVSRASIFSGQWQRRHGIDDFARDFSEAAWRHTYPAILREAGYRTGFIGKFGVGTAAAIAARKDSFDYWRGLPGQAGEFFIEKDDPERRHATARFGDQAVEFLDACRVGQPFCLSIGFNAVHARDGKPREFEPDPRDESLHASDEIPTPKLADEASFHRLPEFVRNSEARRRWERRFDTPERMQKTLRDYYRLLAGVDREVGRMMETLERRGVANNTIMIFTSDNGFVLGDRGLADKWFMFEESIRVPLIIHDPRLGKKRDAADGLVLNVDLAPTILDLAGLPAPPEMQGRSLRPWLDSGTPAIWRKEFFYEHHTAPRIIPPSEGLRTERWKYIRWIEPNPVTEELYDLETDALETRNLAADPAHAERLANLRERWRESQEELK